MNPKIFVTKIVAELTAESAHLENTYERLTESTRYWAFVDLKGSTNYRVANGPRKGYVRGEQFFTLVKRVLQANDEVDLIKEIGDAVFLASNEFRPLFETLLLIDYSAHMLEAQEAPSAYPFAIRIALGHGPAKRIMRPQNDYLGTPIDHLSRVMSVSPTSTDLVVEESAFQLAESILNEYGDFITVSSTLQVPTAKTKGALKNIYYREIVLDFNLMAVFKEFFVPWKDAMQKDATAATRRK